MSRCRFGSAPYGTVDRFSALRNDALEQMLDAHPDLVSSEERDFIGCELLNRVIGSLGKMPLLDALNVLTCR